ncbi:mucin-3B [Xenopus laevis]|nr:mucin-3B [Xenopus laevis]
MKAIYENVTNYKDVNIRSLKNGSIVVDYDIILEMDYNSEVNIDKNYEDLFGIVQAQLISGNCSDENIGYCFTEPNVTEVPVPTAEELCMDSIEPGYREFYTPKLTASGLSCISHCEKESPEFENCNSGNCQIREIGPMCLCPETEKYLYTLSRCRGRMLKAALYGGVGAGMAVLAIIILTVGILLCKAKQPKKRKDPFSKDQEGKWYEDNDDDEWTVKRGLSNSGSEQGQNDGYKKGMANYENFRPTLENVDTKTEVKIQRPQVSRRW